MIYPLLPNFLARTLKGGPAALGLIEGVAEMTASLMKLVSGWWSDRTRRRKPLVVLGYAIATVARPLVGLATVWTQVLAIRFADRLGKGIRTAPRDALMADLAPASRRGRAFGLQRAMDNAGAVVGPLVAAFLLKFVVQEQRVVFLLAFIPGLAALVLLILRVHEQPASHAPPTAPVTLRPPRSPLPGRLKALIAVYALFMLAFPRDVFLLLRARDVGVPLWQLPLLWSFFNGVKALIGVPAGSLSDRIGRLPVLVAGWAIAVTASAGFIFADTPGAIWALFGLYAVAPAMAEPAERSLLTDMAAPEQRGRAFGLFHASVGIAALPASVLFGLWWKIYGAPVAFAISAALAAFATTALLLWGARRRREAAS